MLAAVSGVRWQAESRVDVLRPPSRDVRLDRHPDHSVAETRTKEDDCFYYPEVCVGAVYTRELRLRRYASKDGPEGSYSLGNNNDKRYVKWGKRKTANKTRGKFSQEEGSVSMRI